MIKERYTEATEVHVEQYGWMRVVKYLPEWNSWHVVYPDGLTKRMWLFMVDKYRIESGEEFEV